MGCFVFSPRTPEAAGSAGTALGGSVSSTPMGQYGVAADTRPEDSARIPIASRPAVQFKPVYPAGQRPWPWGCSRRGLSDERLFDSYSLVEENFHG